MFKAIKAIVETIIESIGCVVEVLCLVAIPICITWGIIFLLKFLF